MNQDSSYLNHIHKLIIVLVISGGLNILLLSGVFYWWFKESTPSAYIEHKPALKQQQEMPLASERGNAELIHYFRSLSFEQLVDKLSNQQLIENGYSQRDIALASLVTFHHLDLTRALVGHVQPSQDRAIIYGQLKSGKPALITVYPGLSDQQFQAIIDFVKTERWPLTSKGLFWALKRSNSIEPTMFDAFAMTPEFLSVELLFNRSGAHVLKEDLQNMLLDGTWAMLSDFYEKQKQVQDLSPARRQRFLLEYIDRRSKAAAYVMLKIDGDFALKKLDDEHVVALLRLMSDKTPESEKFALNLLTRPRGDAVWKIAAAKLYQYAGESIPEKNLHHLAMLRFNPGHILTEVPQVKIEPVKVEQKIKKETTRISSNIKKEPVISSNIKKETAKVKMPQPQKDRLYIVQDGDSLWKISRRFDIDIDVLRNYNKLKSDFLKPGTSLKIPFQKGVTEWSKKT